MNEKLLSPKQVLSATIEMGPDYGTQQHLGTPHYLFTHNKRHPNIQVPTLTEVLGAIPYAKDSDPILNKSYLCNTELYLGYDRQGTHYPKDTQIYVVVHGACVMTHDRIVRLKDDAFLNYGDPYTDDEFDNLLKGEITQIDYGSGNRKISLPIYRLEDALVTNETMPRSVGFVFPVGNWLHLNTIFAEDDCPVTEDIFQAYNSCNKNERKIRRKVKKGSNRLDVSGLYPNNANLQVNRENKSQINQVRVNGNVNKDKSNGSFHIGTGEGGLYGSYGVIVVDTSKGN